ncbi:hypothetical protein [Pseudomonas tohonis]|uniref:hypothetical protein n=1 Tax=Pseudomonas tohonis TaxID=2725477 RepID=UPI001F3C6949|nr:hypothetical protein [Pseudomonas tohonis]
MSDVKKHRAMLLADNPRLQNILPQEAILCGSEPVEVYLAADYDALLAENEELRVEAAGLIGDMAQIEVVRDQLRAELDAIRGQEPFWYAVISERAPVIDKAIRREDVAMEYAEKASATYYGVEVVPLYRLPPQQPDAVSVPRELLERIGKLFPADMDDDGSGRAGFYPHVREAVQELRALLTTKPTP